MAEATSSVSVFTLPAEDDNDAATADVAMEATDDTTAASAAAAESAAASTPQAATPPTPPTAAAATDDAGSTGSAGSDGSSTGGGGGAGGGAGAGPDAATAAPTASAGTAVDLDDPKAVSTAFKDQGNDAFKGTYSFLCRPQGAQRAPPLPCLSRSLSFQSRSPKRHRHHHHQLATFLKPLTCTPRASKPSPQQSYTVRNHCLLCLAAIQATSSSSPPPPPLVLCHNRQPSCCLPQDRGVWSCHFRRREGQGAGCDVRKGVLQACKRAAGTRAVQEGAGRL